MKRLTALTAILLALTMQAVAAPARTGIDFRAELQPIDRFGFSMAFQQADLLHGARGLSPAKQREVLDLLLSREEGAGLSILRLGIGITDLGFTNERTGRWPPSAGPSAPAPSACRSRTPARHCRSRPSADGSRVIEILNTATTESSADLSLRGGHDRYVTDETRSITPADIVSTHGTTLRATLAPRALTTIVLD
ncbi:hypothetical protein ABZY57_26590 [Streptomyces sp. NPDC006450]|uniref:hypothetical protein n=1 Tax=Streptomyces sp. NPDC006450 TaxID=3155458 RepID=UPI0033AD04F6